MLRSSLRLFVSSELRLFSRRLRACRAHHPKLHRRDRAGVADAAALDGGDLVLHGRDAGRDVAVDVDAAVRVGDAEIISMTIAVVV